MARSHRFDEFNSTCLSQADGRKEAQMASKKEEPEKRKPDLIARAKQSPDSDFWITIGAAWTAKIGDKEAYSVKLHTAPINWDGDFLLMPPKDE